MNEVTVKNDRKNNLTRNLQADSKETSRNWQVQDGAVFPPHLFIIKRRLHNPPESLPRCSDLVAHNTALACKREDVSSDNGEIREIFTQTQVSIETPIPNPYYTITAILKLKVVVPPSPPYFQSKKSVKFTVGTSAKPSLTDLCTPR